MSNIIELPNFKSIKDAEEYAKGLFMQLAAAQSQIKELKEKLHHAESMLNGSDDVSFNKDGDDVEKLLLREIGYLEIQSRIGGLDNDETKKLKMLVDGLVSHRRQKEGQDTGVKKPSQKRLNPNELLKLVKQTDK